MPPPYSCTRVRVSAVAGTTSTISPSAVRRTRTERPSSSGRISTQNSSPAAACSQPRAMPDSAMRRAVSGEAQEPYDAMARCPWAAPDRAPSVTRAPPRSRAWRRGSTRSIHRHADGTERGLRPLDAEHVVAVGAARAVEGQRGARQILDRQAAQLAVVELEAAAIGGEQQDAARRQPPPRLQARPRRAG